MKFKEILNLGGALTAVLCPAVAPAIIAINKMIPHAPDKQLPSTATVADIHDLYQDLPSTDRERLREIDIDLAEIASHTEITTTLAKEDSKGASTRPDIAKLFAVCIALIIVPIAWGMTYQVFVQDDPLEALQGMWPLVLAMLTPLVGVIRTYFGNRQNDKRMRHAAAHGQPIPEAIGLISKLFKK